MFLVLLIQDQQLIDPVFRQSPHPKLQQWRGSRIDPYFSGRDWK
jgi:hypothetical protein